MRLHIHVGMRAMALRCNSSAPQSASQFCGRCRRCVCERTDNGRRSKRSSAQAARPRAGMTASSTLRLAVSETSGKRRHVPSTVCRAQTRWPLDKHRAKGSSNKHVEQFWKKLHALCRLPVRITCALSNPWAVHAIRPGSNNPFRISALSSSGPSLPKPVLSPDALGEESPAQTAGCW